MNFNTRLLLLVRVWGMMIPLMPWLMPVSTHIHQIVLRKINEENITRKSQRLKIGQLLKGDIMVAEGDLWAVAADNNIRSKMIKKHGLDHGQINELLNLGH